MLSQNRPRFSAERAVDVARQLYGLEVEVLEELPSERDQNFHLRDREGTELVLKFSNTEEPRSVLELQNEALRHVAHRDPEIVILQLRELSEGGTMTEVEGDDGPSYPCRLFNYLPGRPLALSKPHPESLLRSVGRFMGRLGRALEGLRHDSKRRKLMWRAESAPEILYDGIALVENEGRRELLSYYLSLYETEVAPELSSLPSGVIHNDGNDHNVLVLDGEAAGILDFGDIIESAIVCELANAAAYCMLDKRDPFRAASAVVAGYHEARPLSELELSLVYPLVATRLAMSVSSSARQFREEPERDYLRVSENPAWNLLDRLRVECPRLAYYRFRDACGMTAHPRAKAVTQWLDDHASESGNVLPFDLSKERVHLLDLSVGSQELGGLDVLEDAEGFTVHLFRAVKAAGARVGAGGYGEARPLYASAGFRPGPVEGNEPRSVHLAVDLWVEAGTPVHAPLDGTVHSFALNDAPLDYGPTILLEHETGDGDRFWTLYGHLSEDSISDLEKGQPVRQGTALAKVGNYPINGNWPPHLHFQIILDLLDKEGDYPGVAAPSERRLWLGLSPDPSRLLRLPWATSRSTEVTQVESGRREHLSGTLSLAYETPLHIARGWKSYLYDTEGRPYLDMVNNVCHVGHCHPRVVRAASQQMAVLNTNTRYLHPNIVRYAERLTATLPDPLRVCFFVNSGSEANDLALRLARAHTGRLDTLVLEGAYHGNLTSLIEVSPYKFDGRGGSGAAAHVHKLDVPDGYRGRFRASEPGYGKRYVQAATASIEKLARENRPIGAFIGESIMSCGGQIVLPQHYLRELYATVRGAGGVVIADEVQVGFGRVGSHFWAFETQDAVPDIVPMGKPIGNGHPLGAVVTTREIASSFQTGMEYFNTFGGNPVSCAVGSSVLDVVESEGLRENAERMGAIPLEGLRDLATRHPILGDLRGRGLFLGFEMVRDRESLEPAAEEATYLVNRMKKEGVLSSTDGPLENVIKLKPPLVFSEGDAALFLDKLAMVLQEDALKV